MLNKTRMMKIFLFIWLIGAIFSFILHLFFPALISNLSFWDSSVGWQREIALWNLAIAISIIYGLIKNNTQVCRFLAMILILLSLLLGTNHIFELLINKKIMTVNLLGSMLNYIMMVWGIFVLKKRDGNK